MGADEIDEAVFTMFAHSYPHEAYALDPECFWLYFHDRCPSVSRDDMVRALDKTGTCANG